MKFHTDDPSDTNNNIVKVSFKEIPLKKRNKPFKIIRNKKRDQKPNKATTVFIQNKNLPKNQITKKYIRQPQIKRSPSKTKKYN